MKKVQGPKLYKKLANSGVIAKDDFKFMQQNPEGDADFNPAHNLAVVEETIRKTKAREKALRKEYMDKVAERVDASVYLLKAMASGKYVGLDSNTAATRYFGKRELARLRGEEIRQQLMEKFRKAVNN